MSSPSDRFVNDLLGGAYDASLLNIEDDTSEVSYIEYADQVDFLDLAIDTTAVWKSCTEHLRPLDIAPNEYKAAFAARIAELCSNLDAIKRNLQSFSSNDHLLTEEEELKMPHPKYTTTPVLHVLQQGLDLGQTPATSDLPFLSTSPPSTPSTAASSRLPHPH